MGETDNIILVSKAECICPSNLGVSFKQICLFIKPSLSYRNSLEITLLRIILINSREVISSRFYFLSMILYVYL